MADPKNKKMDPAGNYNVGYKKPPVEHQFKPSYLRDSARLALRLPVRATSGGSATIA